MATLLAKLLNSVDWQPTKLGHSSATDPVLPRTTHSGLIADEFELRCYKRSDGQIWLDFEDIEGFFRGCLHGMTPGPCLICQQSDDSTNPVRLMIMLENEESD